MTTHRPTAPDRARRPHRPPTVHRAEGRAAGNGRERVRPRRFPGPQVPRSEHEAAPTLLRRLGLALLLACAWAAPTAAGAQSTLTEHTLRLDEGQPSPPASIGDFAFLEGGWSGEGLGGEADEVWGRPAAGTMFGAFRLIREGEVDFYEIYALEEHEGTVVFRLKHFEPGPGLPGWEEREEEVTFRLVRVEPERAWFHGLTFHREGPDSLVVHLALRNAEGVLSEQAFRFRRQGG